MFLIVSVIFCVAMFLLYQRCLPGDTVEIQREPPKEGGNNTLGLTRPHWFVMSRLQLIEGAELVEEEVVENDKVFPGYVACATNEAFYWAWGVLDAIDWHNSRNTMLTRLNQDLDEVSADLVKRSPDLRKAG